MDEIKIDITTLEDAGEAMGFMVAAFMRGFHSGIEAFELAAAAYDIQEVHTDETASEITATKTEISDCRACWCDQCAKLEVCEKTQTGSIEPDSTKPLPCFGCKNGLRFKPCEEPPCEEFVQGEGLNNG